MLRFVDVSGVGNSGKSAASDILREFDGFWVPPFFFEFDLLRGPGGLLALKSQLVDDWSPIRSHQAVRDFRHAVRAMGSDPAPWNVVGIARSSSQRYDRRFNGKFTALADEFLDSLVVSRYRAYWPYDYIFESPWHRLWRKAKWHLGMRFSTMSEVMVADGGRFDDAANEFMGRLFGAIVPPDTRWAALNNAFEPFNPVRSLDIFPNSRCLIVIRDPRDVYVSGKTARTVAREDRSLQAPENDGINKSFLASDDVRQFVTRYKVYLEHTYRGSDPRVLMLRFEALCLDYQTQLAAIMRLLDVAPGQHTRPRAHFDPERSKQNVGLWRRYSRQDEIDYIARELKEYLWSESDKMAR
jgi:sulfotransferase family protein